MISAHTLLLFSVFFLGVSGGALLVLLISSHIDDTARGHDQG